MSFHIVIPARFQSSRFPGKLLQDLNGKSVLERTYRQACEASSSVIIATDHEAIYAEAKRWGAEVIMTHPNHQTGTDRIAEVVTQLHFSPNDIIVNVQGDEPFISPDSIQQVATKAFFESAVMTTLCWPLSTEEEYFNPNVVKVVRNRLNHALYFSRAPIPVFRDSKIDLNQVFRHIGLYAYQTKFILEYVKWPTVPLESFEMLEQLRVLWMGHSIYVATAHEKPGQDINTLEDLERARLISFV